MTSRNAPIILMAEDDMDDRMMTQEALRESNLTSPLYFVGDGEELLDYLHHRGQFVDQNAYPTPDIILLDLNMPKKDGREALVEIKSDPKLCQIPVIVLTTSREQEDVASTYQHGASSYLTKPSSYKALCELMRLVNDYWLGRVRLPESMGRN